MSTDPSLSLDLVADVRELLAYPFMVHALEAGTIVAALGSAVLAGPEDLLFGTFLGVTTHEVLVLLAVAVLALALLGLIGRPLLFATLDREVAGARGVPVRALDVVFLLLLAAAVAAAS